MGALSNVKKGLGDIASTSLEAKVAIIGAMYALERLFAVSGKTGTDLANFNALTGDSVKTLQQYQYAARQVGVSNEEVEGSFKSLQGTMTKTLMGEGGPKGLARVSLLTGGISQKDIQEYAKNPEKLIQRLQQYASKETNIGLRNETLKSFGLGENMIAALSRNAFRPEVLKKAPTYSDSEVKALDKANVAWSNLGTKIQMAVGHFNAMHGGQLVNDISKIVDVVFKLVSAFTKLAEKLHVFDGIAKVFGLMDRGLTDVNDKVTAALNDKQGLLHGGVVQAGKLMQDLGNKEVSAAKTAGNYLVAQEKKFFPSLYSESKSLFSGLSLPKLPSFSAASVAPSVEKQAAATSTQNHAATIHNHFTHPGVDPKKTGDSVKQSVQQAYRQMHAQAQGT